MAEQDDRARKVAELADRVRWHAGEPTWQFQAGDPDDLKRVPSPDE